MATPFFFSYASIDADATLDKFFAEVNGRVRKLLGINRDGFRDVVRIKAGDQWDEQLVDELTTSHAMICMFSPAYFNSVVCAQEMQVFLERRLEYKKKKGKLPSSIIPVIWQPTPIPLSLPELNEERPRTLNYLEDGVWRLADFAHIPEKAAEMNAIAHSVAQRVKDANRTPLSGPPHRPVLGGVESAFEPSPPLPPTEFDLPNALAGPQCVTLVHASTPPWNQWPFDDPDKPLLHVAASIVKARELRAHGLMFDPAADGLLQRVEAARTRNNHILLLVDGESLQQDHIRQRMWEFDKHIHDLQTYDACGTLIGWRTDTAPPNWKALVAAAFPNLSLRQGPMFQSELAGPDKFAQAVKRSLDTLRNSVLKNSQGVTPLSVPTEFTAVPYASGSGDRRAA